MVKDALPLLLDSKFSRVRDRILILSMFSYTWHIMLMFPIEEDCESIVVMRIDLGLG